MQRLKLKDRLRWPGLILLALLCGNVHLAQATMIIPFDANVTLNGGYTFTGSAETLSTDFDETNAEGIRAIGHTGAGSVGLFYRYENTMDLSSRVLLTGTVPLEDSSGGIHGNASAHVAASSVGGFNLVHNGDGDPSLVELWTDIEWNVTGQIAEGDSAIVHLESRVVGPEVHARYNSADFGDFRLGPGPVSIQVSERRVWWLLENNGFTESAAAFSFRIEHNMGSTELSWLALSNANTSSTIAFPEPSTLSVFCVGLLGFTGTLFRHRFGKAGP